jgi:hypothetical protein
MCRLSDRLKRASEDRTQTMVRLLARVIGIGVETAEMLVNEMRANCAIDERSPATLVSPARLTKAAVDAERRDLRVQAMHGCAAA